MNALSDTIAEFETEFPDDALEAFEQPQDTKVRGWHSLDMSARMKLTYGIVIGCVATIIAIIVIGFSIMSHNLDRSIDLRTVSIAATDLPGQANKAALEAERLYANLPQANEDKLEASLLAAQRDLAQVMALRTEDAETIRLREQAESQLATFAEAVRTRTDSVSIATHADRLQDTAQALGSHLRASAERTVASGKTAFELVLVLCIIALAITFLVGCYGLRIARDFNAVFSGLVGAVRQLGNGKEQRQIVIEGADRADELGDLARNLEIFRRQDMRIRELQSEREQAAIRELQVQREREGERTSRARERVGLVTRLSHEFEAEVGDIVSSVAAASSQLKSTASAMADAARSASTETEFVGEAIKEASSGATAAASASDEFAMSIAEISRQAASSAELARKANDAADNADQTISALADSAEQVGHIVEMIQSIAQKTNLLALNASIEAARGGEAGRGFAVVASEVKELAAQTSRATEEVAGQIRSIQGSTGASVGALRSIGEQIRELESTAISIASAVDQQSVAGQDLAKSIDIAARNTDDVSTHIGEVRKSSMAAGSASEQVLSSATDLETQAAKLQQQLSDFLGNARRNFALEASEAKAA